MSNNQHQQRIQHQQQLQQLHDLQRLQEWERFHQLQQQQLMQLLQSGARANSISGAIFGIRSGLGSRACAGSGLAYNFAMNSIGTQRLKGAICKLIEN